MRLKVATTSLAGCFGCHMSFLDLDERLVELCERVEFDRSPLTDIKQLSESIDIGLIEGGLCNAENVETLRAFRARSRILVAVGACAINGGVPALRNRVPLKACLETAYLNGPGLVSPGIPNDPELPLLLDQVHPLHEVVRIDYTLPGCPPPADLFWFLLTAIAEGQTPKFPDPLIHFD